MVGVQEAAGSVCSLRTRPRGDQEIAFDLAGNRPDGEQAWVVGAEVGSLRTGERPVLTGWWA